MPNTPFELNANLRGLRHVVNYAAEEIRDIARTTATERNW